MTKRIFPEILLYIFGMLLLFEWLRPMEGLTDTDYIEVFFLYLLVALILLFFKVKVAIQLTINLLFILVFINLIYYDENIFEVSWIQAFISEMARNTSMSFLGDWNDVSNEFRTILFFILLWNIAYLIDYYLIKRKRVFFFFFITVLYITVLDTFTIYDAKTTIVRTMVFGFIIMGITTYDRINKKEKDSSHLLIIRKWIAPLLGMIAFSVFIGMVAPKAAPIWPNPVPYFQVASQVQSGSGEGGTKTIGYGTDDSTLGGPLLGNDNPVFQYESNERIYWKMEIKDTYTGKGWLSSGDNSIPFRQGDPVPMDSISESVETVMETAQITILENYQYNFIMYPAGINKVIDITPNDFRGNHFRMDTVNERISFYNSDNQSVIPQGITLEFKQPIYKAEELNQSTNLESNTLNRAFYQKYTQLPVNLPTRIQELAEQITAGETSWFDKSKAIEDYFDNPQFSYDQQNVAVPGLEDDYVDQFLFETQRGYCDNFSTSMTVMLRTLGIPARWVKGYTGGEPIQLISQDTNKQIYEVTNNHAHSWVEVFLPNQGWVAFEPTKGYSNELRIDYNTEMSETEMNQPTPTESDEENNQQEEREDIKELIMNPENSSNTTNERNRGDSNTFIQTNWQHIVLILGIITIFIGFLYRFRGKWLGYFILLLYRYRKKDGDFGSAYLILLRQLDRCGLKRKENQTLGNFAHDVDSFYSTGEMSHLTKMYEQFLYYPKQTEVTWEEVHQLWEGLLKRTIN